MKILPPQDSAFFTPMGRLFLLSLLSPLPFHALESLFYALNLSTFIGFSLDLPYFFVTSLLIFPFFALYEWLLKYYVFQTVATSSSFFHKLSFFNQAPERIFWTCLFLNFLLLTLPGPVFSGLPEDPQELWVLTTHFFMSFAYICSCFYTQHYLSLLSLFKRPLF